MTKARRMPRRVQAIATRAVLLATLIGAGGTPLAVKAQAASERPSAAAPSSAAPSASAAQSPGEGARNDFPTLARVEYVFECLNDNPGPRHEMLYKCVCAADRVAEAVSYDRWVELWTFFNAQPMAGERGAYVRERTDIQAQLKGFRELQLNAKKACFIPSGAK